MSITIIKKVKIVFSKIRQNFIETEESTKMSIDLPDIRHFDDFYIWFNKDEKKEYYSTPMYFYKADFSFDFNNKEDNKNKNRSK